MTQAHGVSRRSVLLGGAAAGLLAASGGLLGASRAGNRAAAAEPDLPVLWQTAARRGLLYGSSAATWQLSDAEYRALYKRESAILFTEDDFLWWRLRPTPTSGLDFTYPDKIVAFAERNNLLMYGGPGLVWDQGFGDGWTDSDLWDITEERARELLYGTERALMSRYRGRVQIWAVVNEAIAQSSDANDHGLRMDVPWYKTIGPQYAQHAFHVAREVDPHATLLLNDFGYETVDQYGDTPEGKRANTLMVIDGLLKKNVPLDAFGIQAHLLADQFAERFNARGYRQFLRELADRGLTILITEMDVQDDGLPAAVAPRDKAIAEVYRRYLDVALEEPAVKAVINFGLSDRYTWLQEDYPRDDGAARRPLPFDENMNPKPAFWAINGALQHADHRHPTWRPRR